MYVMLKDEQSIAAKKSLEVMTELYRKRIWTDAKTVNVIATACLSNVSHHHLVLPPFTPLPPIRLTRFFPAPPCRPLEVASIDAAISQFLLRD